MEYQFTCSCGKRIRVKEEHVGRSGLCKSCGRQITMSADVLEPIDEADGAGDSGGNPDAGAPHEDHESHRTSGTHSDNAHQTFSPCDTSSPPARDGYGGRKTMGVIERYLHVVFGFSKIVSAVFILLCPVSYTHLTLPTKRIV